MQDCNPNTLGDKQEDHEFETSLSYTVRPYLQYPRPQSKLRIQFFLVCGLNNQRIEGGRIYEADEDEEDCEPRIL